MGSQARHWFIVLLMLAATSFAIAALGGNHHSVAAAILGAGCIVACGHLGAAPPR
jgi:hypothetical protein